MNKENLMKKNIFILLLLYISCLIFYPTCIQAKESKTILSAKMQQNSTMNRWNFKMIIHSDCIWTKKEVESSTLKLTKKKTSFSANFLSIDTTGKNLTYIINKSSTKKLINLGSKANGSYQVTSSLFQNSLKIKYTYRNTGNIVCGYLYNTRHKPISNVSVMITSSKDTKILSTKSNSLGYYELSLPSKSYTTLTIKSPLFKTITYQNILPNDNAPVCENFILHTKETLIEQSPLIMFSVKNASGAALNDYQIHINNNTTNTEMTFTPCLNGYCYLSTKNRTEGIVPTTLVTNNPNTLSYIDNYSFPYISENISTDFLNFYDSYTISIEKPFSITQPEDTYEIQSFTCNFSEFPTDAILFQVSLQKAGTLAFNSLTVDLSKITNVNSSFTYQLALYKDTNKEPIYKISDSTKLNMSHSVYSLYELIKASNISFFTFQKGIYYLAFSIYDTQQEISYSISPITLSPLSSDTPNNFIPKTVTVYPNVSKKILAYEKNTALKNNMLSKQLSFDFYQVVDNHLIFLRTLSTSDFYLSENSEYYCCDIFFHELHPNSHYFLVPIQKELTNNYYLDIDYTNTEILAPFSLSLSDNPNPSIENSLLAQIQNTFSLTSHLSSNRTVLSQWDISFSDIRNNPNFPYAFLSLLNEEGKIISTIFLTKPTMNNDLNQYLLHLKQNNPKITFILYYENHQTRKLFSFPSN